QHSNVIINMNRFLYESILMVVEQEDSSQWYKKKSRKKPQMLGEGLVSSRNTFLYGWGFVSSSALLWGGSSL
ncbi:MAG: hypothetical protein ACOCSA_03075, partial [Candidatus Hadarchaeota archaeon]